MYQKVRGRICILVREKMVGRRDWMCTEERRKMSKLVICSDHHFSSHRITREHLPFVACNNQKMDFLFLIFCLCILVKSECGKGWDSVGKCWQMLFVDLTSELEEPNNYSAATCWYLPHTAILSFPDTMSHSQVRTQYAFRFSILQVLLHIAHSSSASLTIASLVAILIMVQRLVNSWLVLTAGQLLICILGFVAGRGPLNLIADLSQILLIHFCCRLQAFGYRSTNCRSSI